MIPTDIGPLPSDLWEHLGRTPPTSNVPAPPSDRQSNAVESASDAPVLQRQEMGRMDENAQLLEHKCVPFVEELIYKDLELTEEG